MRQTSKDANLGGILLLSCLDLSKGHIFPAPQKGWKLIRFEEKGSPWQQELRRHSKKRKAASPSSTFFKMLLLPRNSTSFTWKSPTRKGKTASKPPFWGSSRLFSGCRYLFQGLPKKLLATAKNGRHERAPCCVAICSDPKKNIKKPNGLKQHLHTFQLSRHGCCLEGIVTSGFFGATNQGLRGVNVVVIPTLFPLVFSASFLEAWRVWRMQHLTFLRACPNYNLVTIGSK